MVRITVSTAYSSFFCKSIWLAPWFMDSCELGLKVKEFPRGAAITTQPVAESNWIQLGPPISQVFMPFFICTLCCRPCGSPQEAEHTFLPPVIALALAWLCDMLCPTGSVMWPPASHATWAAGYAPKVSVTTRDPSRQPRRLRHQAPEPAQAWEPLYIKAQANWQT